MEKLQKHLRTMQFRFLGSAAAFLLFLLVAISSVMDGRLMHNDVMVMWIVPLALSIGVLPRSTSPDYWPRVEDEDVELQIDHVRGELGRLQMQALYLRFVYLGLAFFVLGVLPRGCA